VERDQAPQDGDVVFIRIPELDIANPARQPGEVAAMARDCIATWLGVDAGAFDGEVEP
jgi:hypothetical protein